MSNKLIKKNHGSAFKFNVVLHYLKGDQTAIELSKEFGVSPVTISKWVKTFKQNGKDIFEGNSSSINAAESLREKEISNLYSKIGQLTIERDFLKKP